VTATVEAPATVGRPIQAAWAGSVMILIGVTAVGMTIGYRRPELLAVPEFIDLLNALGVPVWFAITLGLVLPVVSATVLAGLVWRGRRADPMALLLTLGLLGLFVLSSRSSFLVTADHPGARPLMMAVDVISIVPLVFLVFVFPTGTFRPQWGRLLAYALTLVVVVRPTVGQSIGAAMADMSVPRADLVLAVAFSATLVLAGAAGQVARYRRYSTANDRTQARWAFFMVGLLLVLAFVTFATLSADAPPPRWAVWVHLLAALVGAISPLTLGVGLFRHHLYDLDGIISRTVTYTLVAAAVAAIYLLPVLTLPRLLDQSNDLITAASTLAAATVFNPARRRIQRAVDRRFNRAHYDAVQELDAYATRLADQVDLDTVTTDLQAVVARTLTPTTTSTWIRHHHT
jgi:hypothetical protein